MSFSKEIWGNNIWYLFHGIARKINEKKFKENKEDIIFIFKNISNTLPCPECSKDAIIALNKVNFNLIDKDTFLFGYGLAQIIPGPLFTFSGFLGTSMDLSQHKIFMGIIFEKK